MIGSLKFNRKSVWRADYRVPGRSRETGEPGGRSEKASINLSLYVIQERTEFPNLIVITFASGGVSPICDIEPLMFRRYSPNVKAGQQMKIANRRENPRIEIELRCHITSPALWAQSAIFTENISRSGILIGWRREGAALPSPVIGQIVTVEIELPANHGFGQKCIHSQGTVIRVTQLEAAGMHMALRVNYMDFRSFHDRLCALEALQPVATSWMA